MPAVQVKKVVVVCFLEATKLSLEHLAAYRLELSQRASSPASPDLARQYGEIRRLRDYLQRCASAYQEVAELDLSPTDQGLLVAICRRAIDAIDHRLAGEQLIADDEKQWLQRKRQVLADWCVELAEKPLVELPMPRVSPVQTDSARALLARLQDKLFGDVAKRTKIRAPTAGINSVTAGVRSFADELAAVVTTEEDVVDPQAQYVPRSGFGLPSATEEPPPLLEAQQLRDPRLRSLAAMDLAALSRARIAKDYRIAAVMMASVLEAALLDHAIPRRAELNVTGTPDTWNMQDLLVQLMGEAFTPKDRSLAYHLFSARNLLRPGLQIVTPTVITLSSFEKLTDFVHRALYSMGFSNTPGAAGDPLAAHADDAPPAPLPDPN
ncbi:MAG: hypothetical protein JNM25_17960 [Planctomycetes bacterium]|nr:hypothetical protein [Planctomycetota bacterium]